MSWVVGQQRSSSCLKVPFEGSCFVDLRLTAAERDGSTKAAAGLPLPPLVLLSWGLGQEAAGKPLLSSVRVLNVYIMDWVGTFHSHLLLIYRRNILYLLIRFIVSPSLTDVQLLGHHSSISFVSKVVLKLSTLTVHNRPSTPAIHPDGSTSSDKPYASI